MNRVFHGCWCTQGYGKLEARLFLFLLEDAWVDNADNDKTGDDQGESDEGYQEDAAPAGRKFAPNDPVLE